MTEQLVPGWHIPGDPAPESRFTPATDLCPHPGRWSSTDGDSTEIEVSELIAGLVRGLQPRCCLETGAAFGQTAEAIGRALADNGHGTLWTLENDAARVDEARERTAMLSVIVVDEDSMSWQPPAGTVFEFCLFDSMYELRVPEFLRYHPNMREGTIVAFHDTAPGHGSHRIPGGVDLRSTIEHHLGGLLRVIHLPTPRGITLGEVTVGP